MASRARRILKLAQENNNYEKSDTFSEDKTSGSEYVPSSNDSSCSDGSQKNYNRIIDNLIPQKNYISYSKDLSRAQNLSPADKVQNWLASIDNNQSTPKNKINIIQNIVVDQKEKNNTELAKSEIYKGPIFKENDKEYKNKNCASDGIFCGKAIFNPTTLKTIEKESISSDSHSKDTKSKSKCDKENQNYNDELDPSVIIREASKRNGRRFRNKVHSCFFCMNTFQNLPRHFQTKHVDEIVVAKNLSLPKYSKKRKDAFLELIRSGDFNHNCQVLACKEGELILVRRPTPKEAKFLTYSDYGPCPDCLGFMIKRHLWHHSKKCPKKDNANEEYDEMRNITNKHILAESNAILSNTFGEEFSKSYITQIVNKLRDDKIAKYCKNDSLIMKFGAFLFEKYDITQSSLIRQSMRQLGRLLHTLQDICSVRKVYLTDFLVPERFDDIVKATKLLCVNQVVSHNRPSFEIPSLALKLGFALKKCVSLQRGVALKRGDLQKDELLRAFLDLLALEWNVRISSNALNTLYKRKMNKMELLPLTDDLMKLNAFITNHIKDSQENLRQCVLIENWHALAISTLSRIILFNKRRSGEAARMRLENFNSMPSWIEQTSGELKNSLTPLEIKLTEKLTLIEIEGKRGRKVPVILTSEMKESINLLIATREQCGIARDNPYIFAKSKNSTEHLRGHDCLSKMCSKSNLQNPMDINSTKLRKYVATVCQIFNMNDNEYDWLARHLGHDIRVHREFYRLQESAVELTKVSRLLLAIDSGKASQFAGKKLQEIEIDDLPDINEQAPEENTDSDEIEIEREIKEPPIKRKKSGEPEEKHELHTTEKNSKKRKFIPLPWSTEEKKAVLTYFKINIKNGIIPGKEECNKCKEQYDTLMSRDWTKIKYCVKNQIEKNNKLKSKKK